MSTEILSFNGRVNIACDIVKRRYREALLLGAGGNSREATTDPIQINHLVVKFRLNEHECIIIFEKDYGVFEAPIVIKLRSDDLQAVDWPIRMDLKEASTIKQKQYPDPYVGAGIMHPIAHNFKHSQFFFLVGSDYVFVDTITGEVTRVPFDKITLNDEGPGITFDRK